MTPNPVHKVISEAVISTLSGLWRELPFNYAMAVLVPAGRILSKAPEISRKYASVLPDVASTAPSTSNAGKKVRIMEYADALATANASCWKARQQASRSSRQKRLITGQRVAPSSTSYNREISNCSRSRNCSGVAYMVSKKAEGRLARPSRFFKV